MPTYAYECQGCGHGFEKFQSMTANALRKCPDCGERKLQRLIGPGAGVIFKGSGFYETDYRSDSYKKAASADQEGTSSADSSDKKTSSTTDKPGSPSDSGSTDSGSTDSGSTDTGKPAKKDR
jgi:putative FmdB family regulatory protein